MYGFIVEIFCYQMFLVGVFVNLFFSCIYCNGNFIMNFVIDLDDDEGVVFYYCVFICYWLWCVVDIVFVVQFMLQGEVGVWCEWVEYMYYCQQSFLYQCMILFIFLWCFCQFVYQFYDCCDGGVEGLMMVDVIGYFGDGFVDIVMQCFLIFVQSCYVQCCNFFFSGVFVDQFLDVFQEVVCFFNVRFLLFEGYICWGCKYYEQMYGICVVVFNYYLWVDVVVF